MPMHLALLTQCGESGIRIGQERGIVRDEHPPTVT